MERMILDERGLKLLLNYLKGVKLPFTVKIEDGATVLHTRLLHKSGQYIEGTYLIPAGSPQQMGSALTYARRYCWGAMCGISSEEDDDANAAEKAPKRSNGVSDITLGQETLSKAKSRQIYDDLVKKMRTFTDKHELSKWGLENADTIHSMHDDFQKWFHEDYGQHLTAIREGVTEEGKPLVKALKASIEAENGTHDPR